MTQDRFWELYDNREISVKVFEAVEENGEKKTVEAFEHDEKFYLRIHTEYRYELERLCGGKIKTRKRFKMVDEWNTIKEFANAEHANNYFKKISARFKRIV